MLAIATEMKTVRFKRGELIVKYGQLCHNYFVLSKGKIKIIEYEPGTSPHDAGLENKISVEKFVSEEGYGFGK